MGKPEIPDAAELQRLRRGGFVGFRKSDPHIIKVDPFQGFLIRIPWWQGSMRDGGLRNKLRRDCKTLMGRILALNVRAAREKCHGQPQSQKAAK